MRLFQSLFVFGCGAFAIWCLTVDTGKFNKSVDVNRPDCSESQGALRWVGGFAAVITAACFVGLLCQRD